MGFGLELAVLMSQQRQRHAAFRHLLMDMLAVRDFSQGKLRFTLRKQQALQLAIGLVTDGVPVQLHLLGSLEHIGHGVS